jgi:hypothetical protein
MIAIGRFLRASGFSIRIGPEARSIAGAVGGGKVRDGPAGLLALAS